MRRLAFYTRISTDERHQKYSLSRQVDMMTSFCRERYRDNWYLIKVYADEKSGKDTDRLGLQGMLQDAGTKAFDELLVLRVDRLARNARAVVSILDALSAHGIAFRSVTEPFDTSGPAGRMMLQVLGSFAEFEHNAVSERVKVSMLRKARAGRYPGNRPPYGYDIAGSSGLVVNPDEAAVVRKVFDMYVRKHMGTTAIAHALDRDGVRTRSGSAWRNTVLRRILKNPVYVGKMRWAGVRRGLHEAIVPEETFSEAGKIRRRRANRRRAKAPRRPHRSLLAGILRCGLCGSPMGALRKSGRTCFYYACRRKLDSGTCGQESLRGDLLENALLGEIRALFLDGALVKQVCDAARDLLAPGTCSIRRNLAELEAGSAHASALLAEAQSGFEDGHLTSRSCTDRVRQLRRERCRLAQESAHLASALASRDIAAVDHVTLAAAVERLDEVLSGNDDYVKKLSLRAFVAEITVSGKESIDVLYRVPGPSQLPPAQEPQQPSQTKLPEIRFALSYRRSSRHRPGQALNVSVHTGEPPGGAVTQAVEVTRTTAPQIDPAVIFRCGRARLSHARRGT